jgi:DcuC family C4-dicarboxylate transporter
MIIGPILSLIFIAIISRLLVKNYNPHATLLIGGLLMLFIATLLNFPLPELEKSTGFEGFDLFKFIKEAFSTINAGVGLMIMSIGGFVAYMDKIGASDELVDIAMKPLSLFKKSPYLAASMVIPIGQVLFVAIPSAAGLSLLLMTSLYPILVKLGVSRLSAVSVITASTVFGIGPACATTASAIEIVNLDVIFYFLNFQIPLVFPLSISMMITYYFVNRYYDKKNKEEVIDTKDADTRVSVPRIYAVLPILPIVLLIVFSEFFTFFEPAIKLDTTTVMFISLFVALIFESIRLKSLQLVLNSLQTFWNGMGDIFKSVVTLIIAADIFAKGLISLGFIEGLIQATQSLGLGGIGVGIVMTIMIFLASMLMGSGNAAFFAFGPLVPKIATKLGIAATEIVLPMQLAASMGRTVSPVSGVLIATAEIAHVTPIAIVKRNIIPLTVALVIMLLYHFI